MRGGDVKAGANREKGPELVGVDGVLFIRQSSPELPTLDAIWWLVLALARSGASSSFSHMNPLRPAPRCCLAVYNAYARLQA